MVVQGLSQAVKWLLVDKVLSYCKTCFLNLQKVDWQFEKYYQMYARRGVDIFLTSKVHLLFHNQLRSNSILSH